MLDKSRSLADHLREPASRPEREERRPADASDEQASGRIERRAQQHQNDHRRCERERDAGPDLSCLPPRCARRVASSRVLRTLRLAPLAPSAHDPGLNSAQRKPRKSLRFEGSRRSRYAVRARSTKLIHEPPRITRRAAADSAADARAFSVWSFTQTSSHHSHTFPSMSYRPQEFASLLATEWVSFLVFSAYHAMASRFSE